MLLDKYVIKMSHERLAYVYTLIELVKRGYKRVEARKMINGSDLMKRLELDSIFFFHYDETRWADWVIEDCIRLKTINKYHVPQKVA